MQTTKESNYRIKLRDDNRILESFESKPHLAIAVCGDKLRGQFLTVHKSLKRNISTLLEPYIFQETFLYYFVNLLFEIQELVSKVNRVLDKLHIWNYRFTFVLYVSLHFFQDLGQSSRPQLEEAVHQC